MSNRYIEGLQYELPHPFREDADRLTKQFHVDTNIDSNGVIRWKSNDNVPPRDILEFWDYLNKPFDIQKSIQVQEEETQAFLQEYRDSMRNHQYSDEELSEMKNAFGEGATVINVFTGKETKL